MQEIKDPNVCTEKKKMVAMEQEAYRSGGRGRRKDQQSLVYYE